MVSIKICKNPSKQQWETNNAYTGWETIRMSQKVTTYKRWQNRMLTHYKKYLPILEIVDRENNLQKSYKIQRPQESHQYNAIAIWWG